MFHKALIIISVSFIAFPYFLSDQLVINSKIGNSLGIWVLLDRVSWAYSSFQGMGSPTCLPICMYDSRLIFHISWFGRCLPSARRWLSISSFCCDLSKVFLSFWRWLALQSRLLLQICRCLMYLLASWHLYLLDGAFFLWVPESSSSVVLLPHLSWLIFEYNWVLKNKIVNVIPRSRPLSGLF